MFQADYTFMRKALELKMLQKRGEWVYLRRGSTLWQYPSFEGAVQLPAKKQRACCAARMSGAQSQERIARVARVTQ